MRLTLWLFIGLLALALSACGQVISLPTAEVEVDVPRAPAAPIATEAPTPTAEVSPTPSPSAIPANPPTLLPEEPPPAGAESQFSTDFRKHSVPYSEILSGGPPKDGIPAVDDPKFISVEQADEWLEPQEPVILVVVGDEARAYPIQILMWHEIVNDVIGEKPVTVTFCPLCNSGVAFERTFDGQVLDFGTTGRLRYSNLIMYDRQTETWWQQATGEAIAGKYTGRRLTFVPASMIAWEDFKATYPDGTVLSRDTGDGRDYGRNPYVGYDEKSSSPWLYDGPETPDALPPMARVVTIELNEETVAYPYEVLKDVRVANDTVGGEPVVVLWAPGTASALDASSIADGSDVGAATTFSRELDGEMLTFVLDGDRVVDEQTGSEWDVLGQAVSGPKAGSQLEPVVSINHFWFSWAAFRPETRIYSADLPETTAEPAAEPVAALVELSADFADFDIIVYQGEDVLGGKAVKFSEVLAQGKPVVLNLWAGLCPLCRAEMPDLQKAHDKYGDQVLIVGVDIGSLVRLGSEEDARNLLDELSITYPAGTTPDAAIMTGYKVLGTPANYFLKPNGEIVQRWNGVLTEKQLYDSIEKLLDVSGSV